MVVKYIQEKNKWVAWNGFNHTQISDKEFDTLEEAEQEEKKIEEELKLGGK